MYVQKSRAENGTADRESCEFSRPRIASRGSRVAHIAAPARSGCLKKKKNTAVDTAGDSLTIFNRLPFARRQRTAGWPVSASRILLRRRIVRQCSKPGTLFRSEYSRLRFDFSEKREEEEEERPKGDARDRTVAIRASD